MRHFFTIFGHELRMLLVNGSTYLAAVVFLFVTGFVFTFLLEEYSQAAQETSPAYDFFRLFLLAVFIIVPLTTMKCFSEERRLGTLETLLTTPVSTTEVVLGKYSAAYFIYLLLWGSTGGLFYLLHHFASDPRLLDRGTLIGGYVFIAVSGLLFVAIGVFASALARNQAVALVLAFALLFILIWAPSSRSASSSCSLMPCARCAMRLITPRCPSTSMISAAASSTPGNCSSISPAPR